VVPRKGALIKQDELSAQLLAAIAAVIPPEDPLDAPDFDSVAYINNLFPTEQSLSDIDAAVTRVRIKMNRLDADVFSAVREQASSADDGRTQVRGSACVRVRVRVDAF
jgi:hypothetical protein